MTCYVSFVSNFAGLADTPRKTRDGKESDDDEIIRICSHIRQGATLATFTRLDLITPTLVVAANILQFPADEPAILRTFDKILNEQRRSRSRDCQFPLAAANLKIHLHVIL